MKIDNNSYSPAEILMSRKLRSVMPSATINLKPQNINFDSFNKTLNRRKQDSENYYNRNVRKLCPLDLNLKVMVQLKPKGIWSPGIVVGKLRDRCYRVKMENGNILVRNRKFIKPCGNIHFSQSLGNSSFLSGKEGRDRGCNNEKDQSVKIFLEIDDSSETVSVSSGNESENISVEDCTEENSVYSDASSEPGSEITNEEVFEQSETITSSGRLVRPPQRLDL